MRAGRFAFGCALAAVVAAVAVPDAAPGLGLSMTLVVAFAAATLGVGRRLRGLDLAYAALAVALATMAVVRDATWVVVLDGLGALTAATLALARPATYGQLALAATSFYRWLPSGLALAAGQAAHIVPGGRGRIGPAARGTALAAGLVAVFGALFASADGAFAQLAGDVFRPDLRTDELVARVITGLGALALVGALVLSARPLGTVQGPRTRPRLLRTEWLIPLGALNVLFGCFVVVQFAVLFGGDRHVLQTAGLGYGEYARHGFTELLAVVGLTFGVIAVATRHARRDTRVDARLLKALLGVLIALCAVILASAVKRLDLVEDAYGASRVRFAGHLVLLWCAGTFAIVLLAGLVGPVARQAPHLVALLSLALALGASLANPDARIARANVDRLAETGKVDEAYLMGLSADAVPVLATLPDRAQRCRLLAAVDVPPDGLNGFNLSRRRAAGVKDRACGP